MKQTSDKCNFQLPVGSQNRFIVDVATLTILAIGYVVGALVVLGIKGSLLNLLVYVSLVIFLPLINAAFLSAESKRPLTRRFFIRAVNTCALILLSLGLSIIALVCVYSNKDASQWHRLGSFYLFLILGLHFGFWICGRNLASSTLRKALRKLFKCPILKANLKLGPTLWILLGIVLLFRIELKNPFYNLIFGMSKIIRKPPITWYEWVVAALFSGLICFLLFRLIPGEKRLASQNPLKYRKVSIGLLGLFSALTGFWYLDFSLEVDVLHFLTNIAPASRLIHGGVPMVDTFSQYGPGPLLATLLSLIWMGPSFGAANLMTQLFNVGFYIVYLVAAYRLSQNKISNLILSFLAIGVLLAGWWGGDENLNSVPSSMGFRYLPNILTVLAISFLDRPRTVSPYIFLAMTFSALWSVETFIGSAGVYCAFLFFAHLRMRRIKGFFHDLLMGLVLPVATSIFILGTLTFFWGGQFPNYFRYLEFLGVYNLLSGYWAIPSPGLFWGWIPFALIFCSVVSAVWYLCITSKNGLEVDEEHLVYRILPMTILAAFMASYYAGRSVDFTLIISFLPFMAVLLPAIIHALGSLAHSSATTTRVLKISALLGVFWCLTFSFMALYRRNAPYELALTKCLHEKICSPISLFKQLNERVPLQPMLDPQPSKAYFDRTGTVVESLELIRRWAPLQDELALFAGLHRGINSSIMTDSILFFAQKTHRWPISFTFTDELVPSHIDAIANAPVSLEEGEVVFIRKEENFLSPLEATLVAKLRTKWLLCPIDVDSQLLNLYRVSKGSECIP